MLPLIFRLPEVNLKCHYLGENLGEQTCSFVVETEGCLSGSVRERRKLDQISQQNNQECMERLCRLQEL